ncbi:dysbindin domain-containing protein 2-like [Spea bombifrons]|uniref:dysbindin domain-containing protein 2-like n=1 Tax=Spea bombifrons TaxID=233779 RepID=UPI0023498ADF|nr:dysbindin domain-containing protein 2-like [Spea bombifrons]
MTARSQGHPKFQPQTPTSQLLRERQRFFEDVLEHDVDLGYPQIQLLREHWRPPLDSVSSMEVNIDSLELSDPLEISEVDPSDAFQQSDDHVGLLTPSADNPSISGFSFPLSPTSETYPAYDDDTADGEEEAACVRSTAPGEPDIPIPDSISSDRTEKTACDFH